MAKKTSADKLMSLRTAVLLIIALIAGIAVGALTYMKAPDVPTAVLAGGAAFAAAIMFLDKVIE